MRNGYLQGIVGVLLTLVLGSCVGAPNSAGSQRQKISESVDLQQILIMPQPPEIIAEDRSDIAKIKQRLERLNPNALAARQGARLIDANALPWLAGSTEGRGFLANPPGRVLVRGTPASFCPIALTESGPGSAAELASRALSTCIAESEPGCGCQVIALGSILMVPREEVAYATGISARIRARSLGLDGFLVAEETPDGVILLRDVSGIVGKIVRGVDEAVTLTFANASQPFTGEARGVGFRRGRLAERVYATDSSGNRVSLLIGFEPDELAQFAGAWLAWPPDA
ncbi:MAG: hypothetical protein AAF557_11305 [Pseudomonadota bacterium]